LLLFGVEALAPTVLPLDSSSTLGELVGQFLQFSAVLQPWPENQGRLGAALHVHQVPDGSSNLPHAAQPTGDEHIRPWDAAEYNGVGRAVLTL